MKEYVDEHVDEMIEGKKSWKDKGMDGQKNGQITDLFKKNKGLHSYSTRQ